MKLMPRPIDLLRNRNHLLGLLAKGRAVRLAADDFRRPRRLLVPERERQGPIGEAMST